MLIRRLASSVSSVDRQAHRCSNRYVARSALPNGEANDINLSLTTKEGGPDRRQMLFLQLSLIVSSQFSASSAPVLASESQEVLYTPNMTKTPSLRAGVIREPYSISIPSKFKEAKIANILSGNFCMPNCGEPWVEFQFEDGTSSKVTLLVIPLVKLTNKVNVPISSLGSPESLLPRIGGYLTGTFLEDDDLVSSSKADVDGREYYFYELYAPAANGHTFSSVTVKGDNLYMLVAGSNDKAWVKGESSLKAIVKTFRA